MLKKIIALSAIAILPAGAFAADFRTLSHAGTPAQSSLVNGDRLERRVEAPYAMTGERAGEQRIERLRERVLHFNWQAGSANFRPGK